MRVKKESIIRYKVVIYLLVFIWVLFFLRLGYIQIFRNVYYSKKARKQNIEKIIVRPERGKIYDRNGKIIATNVETKTLVAFPGKIEDKRKTASLLSKYGYGDYSKVLEKLNNGHFVYIERNLRGLPPEEIRNIEGIDILQDRKRYYPYGHLCSSVVGFVGTEYRGLEGLEFKLDSVLGGKPGWAYLQKSPSGLLYPHPALPEKSAEFGKNVILTIDIDIQSIVLSELQKALESTSAEDGIVVVVNPKTGEILAMVNLPSYNPNKPFNYDRKLWINRAISKLFEPGSTFKIVTATSAIEEKLFDLDDIVEEGKGSVKIGGVKIQDAEEHGPLTFVEFVEHSSNVAATKIAQRVGKKKFYCYARAFGFGSRTKVNLPGEGKGNLGNPLHWSPLKFATMSFGQGVSVTALQLVFAYGAVANEGILLRPQLVKSIISSEGDIIYNSASVEVRRVMKKKTASILKDILIGVVNCGTGKFARIDGVKIAGKTGTAEKSKPITGYEKGEYVASFIGFFPAEDPQLLIGVFIDEPKGLYWGGYIAAPLFKRISRRILCLKTYNNKIINNLVARKSEL
jgi:stage V sporulation protein D (sporulation-specific penicillin-binding protein)